MGLEPCVEICSLLLSLDLGVGVFHEFFLIDFVEVSYCRGALQRRALTSQQVN